MIIKNNKTLHKQISTFYLYHFEPLLTTLGPGKRSGIWFQGCRFACQGCLVPDSWDFNKNSKIFIYEIVKKIKDQADIEGITISGGEPFLQIDALDSLIYEIKQLNSKLTFMIYTGFTMEELISMGKKNNKKILNILKNCDILIDGKFEQHKQINDPWRGSSNQKIHFLSKRYSIGDYQKSILSNEIHIDKNGKMFISGIPNKTFKDKQELIFKKKIF